jgi:phenylpropionate dioxygenase-like ring-hydroxylating dioxygenase large terminal subunit
MRKEYELACNWKVYVDNYLEGYHIPVVHPTLNKEIDYDSYRRSRSATAPSTPRSPVEASPR